MKKALLAAALCALITPLFATEWGGVYKNNSQVSSSDFKSFSLNQNDALYFWANQPLNEDGSIYASAEAFYQFKYAGPIPGATVTNTVDIDLLKIAGALDLGDNSLDFSAGRFYAADNTGAVFAQVSDGAYVKYSTTLLNVSAYAGYTGLLNGNSVTLLDSNAIAYDSGDGIYTLSHGFVPVTLGLAFPVLFGNQSLSVQGNAFIDLGAEKENRYYGNLVLSGPITNSVYYKASAVAGSTNFKNLMVYSSADVYIFPLESLMINAGAEYASGKNGGLSPFAGVSTKTAYASASSPETSGVILVKANTGISLDSIYTGAGAKVVMDCLDSFMMKGIEGNATFTYSIFSDFQAGVDLSFYKDFVTDSENNFSATLRAAISF